MKRWQYGEGKYLGTVSINRNAVSSGPSVDALRDALGLGVGHYDASTRLAVMTAQQRAGLDVTGIVTETDWDAIVNGAQEPAGGPEAPEPPAKPKGTRKPRASRAKATNADD